MSFDPGDKVVCISTVSPCGCDGPGDPAYIQPILGRYYIVDDTGIGACNKCGMVQHIFNPVTPVIPDPYCWPQSCFRKIDPADPEFKSLIEGLKIPTPELV